MILSAANPLRPVQFLLGFAVLLLAPARAQTNNLIYSVSNVAGTSGAVGYTDGTGAAARFSNPSGLVTDRAGNLYVVDSGNNTLRQITPAGVVTTYASRAFDPDTGVLNNGGFVNGTGATAEFSFGKPGINIIGANSLAIDANDTLYVADTLNNAIRRIAPGAVVTTPSLRDSTGTLVELISPDGIAIDPGSNLYVAEIGTNTIRKISPAGIVTVFAGRTSVAGSADGPATSATFNSPRGVAVDGAGNVYVADTNNNTIRRISTSGVVTTLAGSPGTPTRSSAGFSDGYGSNARFNAPIGLAVDAAGNLWVADSGNHAIRRISPTGVVTTVAGASTLAGDAAGAGTAARLREPRSITVARDGSLYISDTKNQWVRKLTSVAGATSITINRQPEIQIVNAGQPAAFTVSATGTAGLTYQWYRNNVAIAGATDATYRISSSVVADDRSFYTAVVASGTMTLASSSAQLQVVPASLPIPAVIIISHPVDTTAESGSGTVLTVEATGRSAVSYQWLKDNVAIPGATTGELTFTSVSSANAGTYHVTVSSGSSSLTSNPAVLTVTPRVLVPASIITQPSSQTVTLGQAGSFSVAAGGSPELRFQWDKNGVAIPGATFSTYTILSTSASDSGSYRVTVTNPVNSVVSSTVTLTLTAAGVAPSIATQPESLSVKAGESATFTVSATGNPAVSYQWQRDGQNVPGATNAAFALASVQASDAASYRVVVSNSIGTAVSNPATLTVATPPPATARLINLSILAGVASGETMTLGTVLGGTGTTGEKALVARAAGPALTRLGVSGVLPDPAILLTSTSSTPAVAVANNNDWAGAPSLAAAFAQVGAFPYETNTSKDSGLFLPNLARGNYTLQVTDPSGGAGNVIAELYDATPAATYTSETARLINVSVLKEVPSGETLTAGFVIDGPASSKLTVLIRAGGPSLGLPPFNIGGVMSDPKLELYNNSTGAKINENNDWGGATELTQAFSTVAAFNFANAATKDSALLVSLSPGQYSVRVNGNAGGGTVIVEVYEVR